MFEHIREWDDWRWQLRHRIRTVDQLEKYIELDKAERRMLLDTARRLRWAITPYYARLMDPTDRRDPLRVQMVPSVHEWEHRAEAGDPQDERAHSPVPSIVRLYPDRVAFKVVYVCPAYCRYCFRDYYVGRSDRTCSREALRAGIEYIRGDRTIRDVLVTGGDPLMLSDRRLEGILAELRAIRHVEILRIGSRAPCTLPQRITPDLCTMLARYHPLYLNTQFNHPREITPEATQACARLADVGIPLGNQSVLLRGVNDHPETMTALVRALLRIRIRPYYLFHCQTFPGVEHLRVPIEQGLEIIQRLRGYVSGLGVPTYMLDTPYGKVPLTPRYMLGREGDTIAVRTHTGQVWRAFDPP